MVWGILGALDAEVALIREKMQVVSTDNRYGTTFYTGVVEGQKIVLVCCGIGKVNAAVCAAAVISQYGADCIVNVGIAGAMLHGLTVLDVVISKEVGFHDQDPVMLKYYPCRAFFSADKALRTLCEHACSEITLTGKAVVGRIVSGDVFVSDSATRDRINAQYAPACVEMEGAAIGQVCHMHDKPFLVIRTLSDAADDEAAQTYDDFMDRAAHQSACIILKMLQLR